MPKDKYACIEPAVYNVNSINIPSLFVCQSLLHNNVQCTLHEKNFL